jgi:hypothetical protein
MTIFDDSRYRNVDAIKIVDEDGQEKRILKERQFSNFPVEDIVTYTRDDVVDLSAFVEYGEEHLWWIIADANRENIPLEDILSLDSGDRIGIPDPDAVSKVF